jgi:hypothetical protein
VVPNRFSAVRQEDNIGVFGFERLLVSPPLQDPSQPGNRFRPQEFAQIVAEGPPCVGGEILSGEKSDRQGGLSIQDGNTVENTIGRIFRRIIQRISKELNGLNLYLGGYSDLSRDTTFRIVALDVKENGPQNLTVSNARHASGVKFLDRSRHLSGGDDKAKRLQTLNQRAVVVVAGLLGL